MDAEHLTFSDSSFDFVLCGFSLQFFPHLVQALSEFRRVLKPGGQIVVTNNSLYNLIRNAYGTQRYEMLPGPQLPSWIDSDRWDILAKLPADAPEREEQMQLRLRSLLEDRFKLDARREVREMPIYALVIARSDGQLGSQMKQSSDECAAAAKARAAGAAAPPPISRRTASRA